MSSSGNFDKQQKKLNHYGVDVHSPIPIPDETNFILTSHPYWLLKAQGSENAKVKVCLVKLINCNGKFVMPFENYSLELQNSNICAI